MTTASWKGIFEATRKGGLDVIAAADARFDGLASSLEPLGYTPGYVGLIVGGRTGVTVVDKDGVSSRIPWGDLPIG